MPLHRLNAIVLGVPDVAAAGAYYESFGLTPLGDGGFATADGGEQLRLVAAPHRRLIELSIGADDADDVERVAAGLAALDVAAGREADGLAATEAGTGVRVVIRPCPRIVQTDAAAAAVNVPGRTARSTKRADAVLRNQPVRPRKLGHVVLGSTDLAATERFFIDGIGFKVSDRVGGLAAFLRCSSDHHNLLVQPAPVAFMHHTSWQVDDVDEIGRAAKTMLEQDPGRHVWGLGRHFIGSNFFWYLKDPAGNFTEYYADLDCIVDDQLWQPGVWEGMQSLYSWGPPPPASFIAPDDLAELMAASHGR